MSKVWVVGDMIIVIKDLTGFKAPIDTVIGTKKLAVKSARSVILQQVESTRASTASSKNINYCIHSQQAT
jgi:hypothetical protein